MKRWKKRALILTAAILALVVIAMAALPLFALRLFWGQRYGQEQYDPAAFGLAAETLTLTTDDGLKLAAWLVRANDGQKKGTVILLSGLQGPSVTAFFGYAKLFADHGFDSLLVEMRARSLSEGAEIGFGMTEWRDVKAAADYLESTGLPIVVMGTSMGAATAIVAAAEVEAIDAVIALSPPSSVEDMFIRYMEVKGVPHFLSVLETPFITLHLGLHYGFDTLKYMAVKEIAKLGARPLLLMQSTWDTQVPFWEYEKLSKAAAESGIDVHSFIREGNWHMICYDDYFFTPWEDTEFANALVNFLNGLP